MYLSPSFNHTGQRRVDMYRHRRLPVSLSHPQNGGLGSNRECQRGAVREKRVINMRCGCEA